MILDVKRFGEILSSRTSGRESALVTLAYLTKNAEDQHLVLDFENVIVLTPSWLSEFVQTIQEKSKIKVTFKESDNPSVISSIEMIQGEI